MQSFISIPSVGASPQIGEILRFCVFFSGYTVFFLGHAPRSNAWMYFHGLWLIRRVFPQGRSFWGGYNNIGLHLGHPPKTPQKGA